MGVWVGDSKDHTQQHDSSPHESFSDLTTPVIGPLAIRLSGGKRRKTKGKKTKGRKTKGRKTKGRKTKGRKTKGRKTSRS